MAGLNSILNIAKRTLSTNQYGISVTSNNIANASTPGYSRQRLNVSATLPEKMTFGYLGSGVDVLGVQRLREEYIDQQVYSVNQNLGKASQQESILRLAESFFQEPSDSGLNAMMTKFFGAFQDLSIRPEESSSRNAVIQRGTMLVESFRRITDGLDSLKGDVMKQLNSTVDKINSLVSEIADLDKSVVTAAAQGAAPNDIMDKRDNFIAELSTLADIKTAQDSRGGVTISIAGTTVVSGGEPVGLKVQINSGVVEITTKNTTLPINITKGELGGLMAIYNSGIPGYLTQLDALANALITNVNAIHSTGYGIGNPPPTGINFFTGTDARSIALDPAVTSNINNIASSADGSPGNNAIALQVAQLQNQTVMNSNSSTVFQFYNGVVSKLGSEIQSAQTETESQTLVLEQLQTQQNSVSGVSLDEEMTNLIKFQKGFDAAARIITTVDEMFDTILKM